MDPKHVSRLQEEQRKAIFDTDIRIGQINLFKEDYKALQERLKTLPDKVTHNVMVPFGKLAFMPGQLVHTNEILVLLGDNWFVERSAKQATEIADRRIQELEKKLKELKAQKNLLEPRLGFTSELLGHGDIKEIIEEYEEAKEKLWDEQHRENVKKHLGELKQNMESQKHQEKKVGDHQKAETFLWSRLDELEKQETERGELNSMSDEKDDEDDEEVHSKISSDNPSFNDRRVSWADEVKKENNSSENDDSNDENTGEDNADDEEGNNDIETTREHVKKIITFTHSPAPQILSHQVHKAGILSPADIYRQFTPKSILKKASETLENTESSSLNVQGEQGIRLATNQGRVAVDQGQVAVTSLDAEQKPRYQSSSQHISSSSSAQKAFTGFVVEKTSYLPSPPSSGTTEAVTSSLSTIITTKTTEEHPKRVSKFKAARLSQN